jgi:hypothetical protein
MYYRIDNKSNRQSYADEIYTRPGLLATLARRGRRLNCRDIPPTSCASAGGGKACLAILSYRLPVAGTSRRGLSPAG